MVSIRERVVCAVVSRSGASLRLGQVEDRVRNFETLNRSSSRHPSFSRRSHQRQPKLSLEVGSRRGDSMSYPQSQSGASSSLNTAELTGSPPSGKKGKLSPHERQAQAISKLLANPEKEVRIPDGPKEKSIRPPRDVMKNVTGSSAGAGSGEFHVYKQQRRREYERIQLMEEQNKKVSLNQYDSTVEPTH